jgi:uridine phosphorylase
MAETGIRLRAVARRAADALLHRIGGPATAIVAEELAQVGVTSIVRVGTCGSMQPSVRPGHLEDQWRERWAALRKLGVLATEMEAAALHAVGQVRGLRTGAIFVPVDDTLPADQRREAMSEAALVAARALADDSGGE